MPQSFYSRIKQIWGLGLEIAKAEFRVRNEGSYLGIFWYLLNPVITFVLLYFIFSDRLGTAIPRYPLYLLLGIIMFNFFQSATTEAVRSITKEYAYLIKSINFPREALILAIVIKNLFSHFFEVVLFCLVLLYLHTGFVFAFYYLLALVPFVLFVFGFCLLLSSITVFFVDLDNIWGFTVKVAWLATPIFYTIGGQLRLFYLNLINPLYYFITLARSLIVYHQKPDVLIMWGCAAWGLMFCLAGLLVFNKLKLKMAELI